MLTPGIKGHAALRVTTENTALAMGSGELPVLATPAVAALIERACWQSVAAELELDQGTVGTALTLAHTAPTPVGMVRTLRLRADRRRGPPPALHRPRLRRRDRNRRRDP